MATSKYEQRGGLNFLDFAPQSPRSKNRYGSDGFRSPWAAEYVDYGYRPLPTYRDKMPGQLTAHRTGPYLRPSLNNRPALSTQFRIVNRTGSVLVSTGETTARRLDVADTHPQTKGLTLSPQSVRKQPWPSRSLVRGLMAHVESPNSPLDKPVNLGPWPVKAPLPVNTEQVRSSRTLGQLSGVTRSEFRGHRSGSSPKWRPRLPWDAVKKFRFAELPSRRKGSPGKGRYFLTTPKAAVNVAQKDLVWGDVDHYTNRLLEERRTRQRFARRTEAGKLQTFSRNYGFRPVAVRQYEDELAYKRQNYREILEIFGAIGDYAGYGHLNQHTATQEPVPGKKRNKIPQAIHLPYRKKKF